MAQRQSKNRDYYFRQVDFIFYREKQIRDAILEKNLESKDNSISLFPVANAHTFSDPTASRALRNLTPLKFVKLRDGTMIKYPEKWIAVIDKTYNWCRRQQDCRFEVAKRRYHNEDYRKTCIDLSISKSTLHRLLESVRMYAALQAVQAGLIKIL